MPVDIFRQLEQENPTLTQKQYICDNNQLNSTKILVKKNEYKIILINYQNIQYLGFTTPLFDILKNNKKIFTDATYKTNALGYKLYSIIGHYNGSGFVLAYLFIKGPKKHDSSWT
ncbi:44399_t:CDS:2, partial [Gigaspora margarita]